GCALRRGLELGQIDPRKVMLLGCRDYDWEEVEFIRKMGVTLVTAATAHRWTGTQLADEIGSRIGGDALHISLDIDSLDPSTEAGSARVPPPLARVGSERSSRRRSTSGWGWKRNASWRASSRRPGRRRTFGGSVICSFSQPTKSERASTRRSRCSAAVASTTS